MSRILLEQFEIHWEIAALDLHQAAAFFVFPMTEVMGFVVSSLADFFI